MGSDISSNYSFSEEITRVGLWIVRRGTVLSTKQEIMFWTLDVGLFKQNCIDKKTRKKYISYLKDRLEEQKKIQYKYVLRIFEITEIDRVLSFSSEPILFSFSDNSEIKRDESISIGIQLAQAIDFLHNNLHYANLGISPNTVVISDKFQVKILLFLNSVSATQNGQISLPFPQNLLSNISFPPKYMSPEILRKESIYPDSDIYSYGVFLHDLLAGFSTDFQNNEKIPEEFQNLIESCTKLVHTQRPTPKQILESEAFSSLVADVFLYINKIILTDEKDRFSFFEGLLELVEVFSPRVFMHMFMPLFIDQMDKEKRFCFVILPIIYKFMPKLTKEEAQQTMNSISFLFKITRPPQIIETTLKNLPVILEKIDAKEILLPLFTALQSEDIEMTEKCFEACLVYREKMSKDEIETEIVSKILSLLKKTMAPETARALISALCIFIDKLDMEYLFSTIIPALIDVWMRTEWIQISDPICDCIIKYDGPPSKMMKSAAALATMMLGNDNIDSEIQIKLINILTKSVTELKKSREFLVPHNDIQDLQISNPETESSTKKSSKKLKRTRTPRPSLTKFNPFDNSPIQTMSHDGEMIYCSSRGEISDFQSSDITGNVCQQTPPSQQAVSETVGRRPFSPQVMNMLHRRSGSGPTNALIAPSQLPAQDFFVGNFSENPTFTDPFSSDLLNTSNPSESLTDSTYSMQLQQQSPQNIQNQVLAATPRTNLQARKQGPLYNPQRQSTSHEAFFGSPVQGNSPKFDSQKTPLSERRQSVQYPIPVQFQQFHFNQYVSDSFNPVSRIPFPINRQNPQNSTEISNSTSFPSIQQSQSQNRLKASSLVHEPENFDDFDFED